MTSSLRNQNHLDLRLTFTALVLAFVFLIPAGSANAALLKGRIETVTGEANPKPPELKAVQLTLSEVMQGKAVTTKIKEQPSYPARWQGSYRGRLRIVSHAGLVPALPEFRNEYEVEKKLYIPGREGIATFKFEQTDRQIVLEPANISFSWPRQVEVPSNSNIDPEGELILVLNNLSSGNGMFGRRLSVQVISNTVRTLGPNIAEQDLIDYARKDLPGGKAQHTLVEDVLRFTMVNTGTMFVQVAILCYEIPNRCTSKTVLQGYAYRL